MPKEDKNFKEKLQDREWRLNHLYKIKTKRAKLETYTFNKMQADYFPKETNRDMALKARQLGFSTDKLIKQLDFTVTNFNVNTAVVAHKLDKVQTLFEMIRLAYQNMPLDLQPKVSYDNRNELYFPEINSKIYVATDTRSETIHNLHVSEVAFIKGAEQKMVGILESVPKDGIISMESTANGTSGYFYNEWENALSEFQKLFYNWMWDDEYQDETILTIDDLQEKYYPLAVKYGLIQDIATRFGLTPAQFNWYINKAIRQKSKVMQEYPTTALEAFISSGRNVFHLTDIQKHIEMDPIERKWGEGLIWELPLIGFAYVAGIDPSEGGGGDNAVISVWNAYTGEQAAEFATNRVQPKDLGRISMVIGKFYNNAFLVPEINSMGVALVDTIKEKYYNIYMREVFDNRTKETTKKIGWRTTGTSKPMLVADLEESVRDQSMKVRSGELLKELKTFVQTDEADKNGYGAEGSNKDDRVMAAGLARQGIKHLPKMKKPTTEAERKLKEWQDAKALSLSQNENALHRVFNLRNRPKGMMRRN